MIVKCAHCGPLPLADVEELGDRAWEKHLAERHPKWLQRLVDAGLHPAHSDGNVPTPDTPIDPRV